MYGPNGERLDLGDGDVDGEETFRRKTPYQIPGTSPSVPPDEIEKLMRTGQGSTARSIRYQRRHIIDPDNRATK
ncbi:MAG: hypothetical protein ABIH36_03500 [bacterium]